MSRTISLGRTKVKATAAKQETPKTLPSVNLLSPWVFDALATRRLRQRFMVAACLLVLLIGAGWCVQHLRAGTSRQILGIEKAESVRLGAQTQALAPVRGFVATVEGQKKTVTDTMHHEVEFSRVLSGLAVATPADADVQSVAVTLAAPEVAPVAGADPATTPPAAVSPCPGPDPFNTRTVVGCVTLSGTAGNRAAVGSLVVNLGASKLFVEPFISTTTTADGEQVTFTGSVGLSKRVYSEKYDDLAALLKTGGSR